MLSLRSRLLVSYGYLVVLLLVALATGMVSLRWVVDDLDAVAERNGGLQVTADVLDAVRRESSLLVRRAALGTGVDANALTAARASQRSAARGVTEPTDDAWAEEVHELLELHSTHARRFQSVAFEELSAAAESLTEVERYASALLRRRHRDLRVAGIEARARARVATHVLGVLMVIGLLSYLVLARTLQNLLLGRLQGLVDVTDAIAAGERRRRADATIDDELGRVARFINQALDHEQRIAALAQGRLAEQRELLVSLVRRLDRPTTVVGIDGAIIASTMSAQEQASLEQLTPEIRRAAKILLDRKFLSADELTTEVLERSTGRAFSIRALAGGRGRVVGWLATSSGTAPREAQT
jgi:HAMP domain-containing protein